jgi:hypothetical protein
MIVGVRMNIGNSWRAIMGSVILAKTRKTWRRVMADQAFEIWVRAVIKYDHNYAFLTNKNYEEERAAFLEYFNKNMTPEQAINEEYYKYG